MAKQFKIVDIFAGPGGLAEGFSSVRDSDGKRIFDIALSIEKEPSAFATLRLRSFTRQFDGKLPRAYYDYLAGAISKAELIEQHPDEWRSAVEETIMLELGTPEASAQINPVLDRIRDEAEARTILIGGPPCQAYSLVGRARNRGIEGYDPAKDHRHFLYQEYIRIIERLKPVAFVMENVKGILSAKVSGESIFPHVLADLRAAGGASDSYTLIPLVAGATGRHAGNIVRCEDYGIPQNRHRVILIGIRSDSAQKARNGTLSGHTLEPVAMPATVANVLAGMPKLRSGLSKSKDDPEAWRAVVVSAFRLAASACRADGTWLTRAAEALTAYARAIQDEVHLPPRESSQPSAIADSVLGDWLLDPDLTVLPNHASRGHMESDLARYAFAAVFAELFQRSPKADEYPDGLSPAHENWNSGKFADRFRVQRWNAPSSTITSHISKDGHYFIHPDPLQCRSLTVREAARLQTFPDNYFFEGNRTEQFVQVGNAVPPFLANQIGGLINRLLP